MGDTNHAFPWVQRAYQEHSPFVGNVKEDPMFDKLRFDPRFGELLCRVNLLRQGIRLTRAWCTVRTDVDMSDTVLPSWLYGYCW